MEVLEEVESHEESCRDRVGLSSDFRSRDNVTSRTYLHSISSCIVS